MSKYNAFNEELTTSTTNPISKEKKFIVLHIASEKGFVDGGLLCFESKNKFLDDLKGDNFHEWFESIIPRLEPNSIIVMDNTPYHSVRLEKIPPSAWKKEDMLSWLESKDIHINRPMIKAQLFTKVKEIQSNYMSYVVDNIAKNAGHTVLRLPLYPCELNPFELAWTMVKGYVKQHDTSFKFDDGNVIINSAIERVTSDDWKNFIQHMITEKNKMLEVDIIMDELMNA